MYLRVHQGRCGYNILKITIRAFIPNSSNNVLCIRIYFNLEYFGRDTREAEINNELEKVSLFI